LDSFPADLTYCLHLLIGFDGIEVDHGGRLPAMGGVGSPMIIEGNPLADGNLGLRPRFPSVQVSDTTFSAVSCG
jgi:hypothetical protein